MTEKGKIDLGDGTVVSATVSAVGEQVEFAESVKTADPDVTCGQCGAIVGPDTKDGEECPTCGAIWPTEED